MADDLKITADGVVIFPSFYEGNTVHFKELRNGLKEGSILTSTIRLTIGSLEIPLVALITLEYSQQVQDLQTTTIFITIG